MNDVDCVVLGAGVVGLAAARAIARSGREVVVIERERVVGMHTSTRNSEIIHAGIHYPPASLKARLCLQGSALLYEYCDLHDIGYRRCGKFVVATDAAEVPHLQEIEANARASGVLDLAWLDGAEARRIEPALECVAALHSPSTGIIDSQEYLHCLLGDAETHGANLAYGVQVTSMRPGRNGMEIYVDREAEPGVRARWIINAAGLSAVAVAGLLTDFPRGHIPHVRYAKGSYFTIPGRSVFSRLIYPTPASAGHLGIHLTLDLAGGARFGPDIEWVESFAENPDYAVDASRAALFAVAVRRYWPGLPAARLVPAYSGIRPKISGPGEAQKDFLISGPDDHGVAGVVNLFGIDSPGLTASLALGDIILALLDRG